MIEYRKSKVFHFSRSYKISISFLSILAFLENLSFAQKTSRNILASFLTENCLFNNTSTFIPTKHCQQSNTWKYWEIQQESYFLIKSDCYFYIRYIFFLLCFMVFSCSTSIRPLFCILSRNSGKYNIKLLFRSWVCYNLRTLEWIQRSNSYIEKT